MKTSAVEVGKSKIASVTGTGTIVRYGTVPQPFIMLGIVWYGMVWYCIILYCIILYCIILY